MQLTTVVCLDISAAFDAISHFTLLWRLSDYFWSDRQVPGLTVFSPDWAKPLRKARPPQRHFWGSTGCGLRTRPVRGLHISSWPTHLQSWHRTPSTHQWHSVLSYFWPCACHPSTSSCQNSRRALMMSSAVSQKTIYSQMLTSLRWWWLVHLLNCTWQKPSAL